MKRLDTWQSRLCFPVSGLLHLLTLETSSKSAKSSNLYRKRHQKKKKTVTHLVTCLCRALESYEALCELLETIMYENNLTVISSKALHIYTNVHFIRDICTPGWYQTGRFKYFRLIWVTGNSIINSNNQYRRRRASQTARYLKPRMWPRTKNLEQRFEAITSTDSYEPQIPVFGFPGVKPDLNTSRFELRFCSSQLQRVIIWLSLTQCFCLFSKTYHTSYQGWIFISVWSLTPAARRLRGALTAIS